jgi:hypothetical protein
MLHIYISIMYLFIYLLRNRSLIDWFILSSGRPGRSIQSRQRASVTAVSWHYHASPGDLDSSEKLGTLRTTGILARTFLMFFP